MGTKKDRRPRALLSVEHLETRDVPAGNVSATLSGGALFLAGDQFSNQVSVQQNQLGDIVILGRNGTTINGQPSVYVGRTIPSAFAADMGAGDDHLEVLGVFAGAITLQGGVGNDSIVLGNVGASGNIEAYGGEQDDNIVLNGVWAHNSLWADGNNGNDGLHYANSGGSVSNFVWNFERWI